MQYILDTNVISELIAKQPNLHVLAWLDELNPADVFLTVITIGEIRKGIEKLPQSRRREELSGWLERELLPRFQGQILALGTEVLLVWGELTGRLEREGRPLTAIDSLIAAIALHGDYCLVTRNDSDFRASGIKVINPWQEV